MGIQIPSYIYKINIFYFLYTPTFWSEIFWFIKTGFQWKRNIRTSNVTKQFSGKQSVFVTMNAVKEAATKFIVQIAREIVPAAGKFFI